MREITKFLKTNWLIVLVGLLIIQFRGRLMQMFDLGFGGLVTETDRDKAHKTVIGNVGKEAEKLATTPALLEWQTGLKAI